MEIIELFEMLENERFSDSHIEKLVVAPTANANKSSGEIKRNPIIIATVVVLILGVTLVVYNHNKKSVVNKEKEQLI